MGFSLLMALSAEAQSDPKMKIGDHENKYKWEDTKTKDEKKEAKFKTEDLKRKDESKETKIKGTVRPMHMTATERTEIRTGETQVRTKEHIEPISTTSTIVEPAAPEQVAVTKPEIQKPVAHKRVTHKRVAVRRTSKTPRYVVRTKVVRDTVFVPSPPEKIVSTQTEYIHDTVSVTRVDTVVKMQTKNTYTGYSVPRGNFKKVILKKDKKTGEVYMKRKEE